MVTDYPKITSIVPNYPAVKLVPGSAPTYAVPFGFKEVIFTCNAVAWPPLAIEWNSERVTDQVFSYGANIGNSTISSEQLQFRDGFMLYHTAKYTCSVRESFSGFSDSVNITLVPSSEEIFADYIPPCTSNSTTAYFQIQVVDTDCTTWMGDYKRELARSMYDVFAGGIMSQCESCVTNRTTVVTSPPTCSGKAAIFRGKITTPQMDRTQSIFCALNNWKQFGPAIIVAGNFMHVNRECYFQLRALNQTRKCSVATFRDLPIPVIAGSLVGLGVVLFILILVVAFIGKRYARWLSIVVIACVVDKCGVYNEAYL